MTTTATDTHEARCLRPGCGRVLRSAKSVTAGYGPTCLRKIREAAIAEAKAGFSEAQQESAGQLIRDGGIVAQDRHLYVAVSSEGDKAYSVEAHSCTCHAGASGRRCYHQLAARILDAASLLPKAARPLALAA